ncbi:putative bifunctional diguanylate cyclase/phosphodiesterase [Roseateles saccharophilus]|uniref:Diguanylate cyclase/phosphodiesterase n=1 Tax=Roseateles saccharophilus TaxID=304 RepID=A0A4R3VED6_ROSSA|nr:EAL domain-containing protein [Roseateles saccharophilus]MDG0833885.1 EAL domain-containing protein [Roseateles saccharophilus]TCV02293.1 diguanylate cyclase/phosphodiesterase [Roseateles saccharophilus]
MPQFNRLESIFDAFAVRIFPAVVLVVVGLVMLWQLGTAEPLSGQPVPVAAREAPAADTLPAQALALLAGAGTARSVSTQLSTRPFWYRIEADAPDHDSAWGVGLPSRHAMNLACWDAATLAPLGQASRSDTSGAIGNLQGGFIVRLEPQARHASLLCRSEFRGPAKISAERWTQAVADAANAQHKRNATMIEAGFGLLAISMVLTAAINLNKLYWAFVGWLFVSMRMALLSEGSDLSFIGVPIPLELLIPVRQWTVALYFCCTIAVLGLLFKQELKQLGGGWLLTTLRVFAILIALLCAALPFEHFLPFVWVATTIVAVLTTPWLYLILRKVHSRTAMWYVVSTLVTLVASLTEVVAAATGYRFLLGGLNSVTAALASALFTTAALAEHMRQDRLQREAAQRTLKAAYDDSPVGLFSVDEKLRVLSCNPAFRAMLAQADYAGPLDVNMIFENQVALALANLGEDGDQFDQQVRIRYGGSVERWFLLRASSSRAGLIECSLQDITDRVRSANRLEFLVNHDPLTECLNLRGLTRSFERSVERVTALAYLDLDRFKLINDLYGHNAGDAVLLQVCERIRSQLPANALLARVGGDEFVLAFVTTELAQARIVCQNICALISTAPFKIENQQFALSVSAGLVSTQWLASQGMKAVVSAADTLCRMAKKRPGTDRLLVMAGEDKFFKTHKEELELINCLEHDRTPEGLFLVMQPELSLHRPFDSLNFEVLIRMRKPSGETLPAQVVIEAAEAHGKTAIIDRWVISTVLAWLETHQARLPNTQFIGVNLSGGSLNDVVFIEDLFALLEAHGDVAKRLCIEITETVALTDLAHMQRFIERAGALGVKVALDDFGAGYSSFGYLKGMTVDALKLDGSLVRDVTSNPAAMAILGALGGLSANLGMKSIGEYVEDLPILKALVDAGVDYAQGWAISKPVMPEQILAASSSADFIQDADVAQYVRSLQSRPTLVSRQAAPGTAAAEPMLH